MRLNRFLAAAGLGSRRACDEIIRSGKVSINGHFITNLATVVAEGDDVRAGGKPVRVRRTITLLLYKPRNTLSTRSDDRGRRTVFDLIPANLGRLVHVGRLDKDSEGLLLLTTDGALAQRLTHPSHEVEKEYEVVLDKAFDPADTAKLTKGFLIEGGRARIERLQHVAPHVVRVVLRQGIKRQIRMMFYKVGYEVTRLTRIRIGGLTAKGMKPGDWKELSPRELTLLESKRKSS